MTIEGLRLFGLTGLTIGAVLSGCAAASAQDRTIKIGALSDQSGLYADATGPGSTLAAQMAVEDSGLTAKGWKIEVLTADHQNKADVGASIARRWIDVDKVGAIVDVGNSSVALAVNSVVKEKNAVLIDSGAATPELTGKACTPNTVHWTYDTYALANSTGRTIVKNGDDTWYFVTADYAFGKSLQADVSKVVEQGGGKVLGAALHPLNTSDFSSFLLQAQSSKAKVIGLANATGDTTNSIKQAAEFGIIKGGQKLAALLLFITDVKSLGLPVAQGLTFTEAFYWDMNDETRTFSKRFAARMKNNAVPTMVHAGVYAGVLHYLKAVAALNAATDGAAVVAEMKKIPTDDPLFGKGSIRADGRKIHPMYLFEVKTPAESKSAWDLYKLKGTVAAEEAFRPLSESECSLVKR